MTRKTAIIMWLGVIKHNSTFDRHLMLMDVLSPLQHSSIAKPFPRSVRLMIEATLLRWKISFSMLEYKLFFDLKCSTISVWCTFKSLTNCFWFAVAFSLMSLRIKLEHTTTWFVHPKTLTTCFFYGSQPSSAALGCFPSIKRFAINSRSI